MNNKIFTIKIIQPAFDEFYKELEKIYLPDKKLSLKSSFFKKKADKVRDALEKLLLKLDAFISEIDILKEGKRHSAEHVRWVAGVRKFLDKYLGNESEYYKTFISFTWSERGGSIVGGPSRPAENFNPQLGIDRVNQEAYLKELEVAKGLLLAARDELKEVDLIKVNPGKGLPIFPEELLGRLPKDISKICDEFNNNFRSGERWAPLLLLRRLLPLLIVRKFQNMNKENEIKKDGDYFDTKALLGKIESHIKEKRIYREIMNYKILTDSSQHSYTFRPELSDVEGAAVKIRVLLDCLF